MRRLSYIARGGVRIERNPMLCFVDTIDWTAIALNTSPKDNVLLSNKPSNECPLCPTGKRSDVNSNDLNEPTEDDLDCPLSQYDSKKRLCWNRTTCQKSKC